MYGLGPRVMIPPLLEDHPPLTSKRIVSGRVEKDLAGVVTRRTHFVVENGFVGLLVIFVTEWTFRSLTIYK